MTKMKQLAICASMIVLASGCGGSRQANTPSAGPERDVERRDAIDQEEPSGTSARGQSDLVGSQRLSLMDGQVQAVATERWVQLSRLSGNERVTFQVKNPADEGTPHSANVALFIPSNGTTVQAAADDMVKATTARPGTVIVSDRWAQTEDESSWRGVKSIRSLT